MSPLWVVPVVVLAIGAVALAFVTRQLAAEVAGLRPAVADLRTVATDAQALRADATRAQLRGAEVLDLGSRAQAARRSLTGGWSGVDR